MAVKKDDDYITQTRKFLLGHKVISALGVVILLGAVSSFLFIRHIQQQHKAEQAKLAQQAYQSNLAKLGGLNNNYFAIFRATVSLPSTTTKTESGWDGYYDGQISQLAVLKKSVSSQTFADGRLTLAYNALSTVIDDLSNELTLAKSNSDMQFQINSDKAKLSSDQSTLANEEGIYNSASGLVGSGLISNSYVVEFQNAVASDETQLTNDQQTYKSQQKQLASVSSTVRTDGVNLTLATGALGL